MAYYCVTVVYLAADGSATTADIGFGDARNPRLADAAARLQTITDNPGVDIKAVYVGKAKRGKETHTAQEVSKVLKQAFGLAPPDGFGRSLH